MARFFKLLCVLAGLLFAGCQEGGEAGDLLGQWRMDGTNNKYVSFSGNVALFRQVNVERSLMVVEMFGNFQHVGDSLFIQCYPLAEKAEAYTDSVENSFGFKPCNDIRLRIDVLNGDRLVVSRDGRQWGFCRY